jgi:LacI family transcriptional regulator
MNKLNPITSKEVARIAGVSQATVSRVFANSGKVHETTVERIRQVASQLGYRPNAMARAMRTSRSGTVGVVVSRLGNPLYPIMLQILGAKMVAAGLRMVVWSTDEGDESSAVDAVKEGSVDGVLMMTATAGSPAIQEVVKAGVPVVLINRVVDGVPLDQVESDNTAGGALVAQYFATAGRRRIALISGPQQASTIRNREVAFREELMIRGVAVEKHLAIHADSFSYQSGFDAGIRLLELANPPDSIFCTNDVLALGVRDAARRMRINVPEDLWLVGYDDIDMARWVAFDLTTIRQPLNEMSQVAVDLLVKRIGGSTDKPSRIVLPNDLIIRGSTARCPLGK